MKPGRPEKQDSAHAATLRRVRKNVTKFNVSMREQTRRLCLGWDYQRCSLGGGRGFGDWLRQALQRQFQHLVDPTDGDDLDAILDDIGNLGEILDVFFRYQRRPDAAAHEI